METNPLFNAISDLEGATVSLEDVENVLAVFDNQLTEWWCGVRKYIPGRWDKINDSFTVVFSLLTLSRRQLHTTVEEASTGVQQAYSAYSAMKNNETA